MNNCKCPINLSYYLEKLLHLEESDRSPSEKEYVGKKTRWAPTWSNGFVSSEWRKSKPEIKPVIVSALVKVANLCTKVVFGS